MAKKNSKPKPLRLCSHCRQAATEYEEIGKGRNMRIVCRDCVRKAMGDHK